MAGGAGAGEEIHDVHIGLNCAGRQQTVFDQLHRFWKIKRRVGQNIFQRFRSVICRRILAVAPPSFRHGLLVHANSEVYADIAVAVAADAIFFGLFRHPLPAAMPPFFHLLAVLLSHRPNGDFIAFRFFQNFVFLLSFIPFHFGNAERIIGTDINRIKHCRDIFPQVPGAVPNQVVPSKPPDFISKRVTVQFFLRLVQNARGRIRSAVEQSVFV